MKPSLSQPGAGFENPALALKAEGSFDAAFDWQPLFEELAALGPAVFLESAGPILAGEAGRWCLLAGEPSAEVWGRGDQIQSPGSAFGNVLDFLDALAAAPAASPQPAWAQGWFGAFSYEFASPAGSRDGRPDFYFFKPQSLWVIDRLNKTWSHWAGPGAVAKNSPRARGPEGFKVGPLTAEGQGSDYEALVEKAKDYIAQGDIYQANLSQKFTAAWEGPPLALYRALREINPGPFMGLFQTPLFTLVSSSPERLIRGRGGLLETRPIAGTRPRGKSPEEDLRLKQELQSHPKELAEHLMLVDLLRNDLGRVARYGTVEVRDYARVESYAKVHHLVSTVEARAREGAPFSEILRSVFPGGTITGCPKIRCMRIIEELEGRPRHFYTGSLGYLAPGGFFDFNILIRSFTLWPGGNLEFFAGAGIVADSNPAQEYLETLHKVEALAQALGTSLLPR
ncbi:MAG TPA: anthranilate synthase component I family protein [bacterium]|nr:anthranilate synthase component I family protein [bacterium]